MEPDSQAHSTAISDPCNSMASETSSAQTPQSTNPFIFPTGTVKLLVTYKGEKLVGLVYADALVLASPVWKKFLFPPWDSDPAPDGGVKEKQIDCTEDDGEALSILLNIAHLNFDAVPPTLEYQTLLQVAVLIDQYDCIKIVRPWLESWMKNEGAESLKPDQDGWLFIAWVFGRESTFETLSKHLVVKSDVAAASTSGSPPSSSLLSPNGKPLATPMPSDIVESILKCRDQLLGDLLQIPYMRVLNLEAVMRSSSTLCMMGSQSQVCDAAVYGSLIRSLLNASLYPRRTPEQFTGSVESLGDILSCIQMVYMKPVKPPPPPTPTAPVSSGLFASNTPTPTPRTPFSFASGTPTPTPGARVSSGLFSSNTYISTSTSNIFGSQSQSQSPFNSFGQPPQRTSTSDINANRTTAPEIVDHDVCATGFYRAVAKVLEAVPSPVLDSHRVHMQLQRGEVVKPAA